MELPQVRVYSRCNTSQRFDHAKKWDRADLAGKYIFTDQPTRGIPEIVRTPIAPYFEAGRANPLS